MTEELAYQIYRSIMAKMPFAKELILEPKESKVKLALFPNQVEFEPFWFELAEAYDRTRTDKIARWILKVEGKKYNEAVLYSLNFFSDNKKELTALGWNYSDDVSSTKGSLKHIREHSILMSNLSPDNNIASRIADEFVALYGKLAPLLKPLAELLPIKELPGTEVLIKYNYPHPLNQILYGPPGTGKTYTTRSLAVAIAYGLDPDFDRDEDKVKELVTGKEIELKESFTIRNAVNALYSRLLAEGRIAFTTFHQSLSYEDFVEGIKPLTNMTDKTALGYSVKDGIIKDIVGSARFIKAGGEDYTDAYYDYINWLKNQNGATTLKTLAQKKEFEISVNSNGNIKVNPKTEKSYPLVVTKEMVLTYLATGDIIDWKPYTPAIGEAVKQGVVNVNAVMNGVDFGSDSRVKQIAPVTAKEGNGLPHILIIDEINRGNVSAIFGELITLIEDGKRAGQPEEISVTLPYSQTQFSLPKNLYIIGTMNTADRSVEALDTALRRRFAFKEILPDPSLLAGINADVDLPALLTAINSRLTLLKDADHTIGHSFLLKAHDLPALRKAFADSILPLFQEFFFGEIEKVALILGDGFLAQLPEQALISSKISKKPAYKLKYRLLNRAEINALVTDAFTGIYAGVAVHALPAVEAPAPEQAGNA